MSKIKETLGQELDWFSTSQNILQSETQIPQHKTNADPIRSHTKHCLDRIAILQSKDQNTWLTTIKGLKGGGGDWTDIRC